MSKLAEEPEGFFKKYRWVIFSGGIILVAGLILSSQCPPPFTPIISTDDGKVQGIVAYSRNGSEHWLFRGIPFAQPPLGKLRFQPPVPTESWDGVWKATQFSPNCFAYDSMVYHIVSGAEDCLYLNVFAPPVVANKTRPVIAYIPGGGFMSGGASYYHPDYFMDHDVVIVTFNYRLGPFGFLNLETEQGDGLLPRGNQGLKDQVLALQWIQRNVEHFGGDVNRITLYGQSAGASSAHLLMLSPLSRGLFHRVALHSGSGFCPWGFSQKANEISKKFVRNLNCPEDDREALAACLENYDATEMVLHQKAMSELRLEKDLLLPSVEAYKADDAFLIERPSTLAKRGDVAAVPLLFGVNSGEGGFRVARFDALEDPSNIIDLYESKWGEHLDYLNAFDHFPQNISEEVRSYYYGNMSFQEDPSKFKRILANLSTHAGVYEGVQRAALLHALSPGSPKVFPFYYNYVPNFLPGMYSLYAAVGTNDWLPHPLKIHWTLFVDWIKDHILRQPTAFRYGVVHGDEMLQLWNLDGLSRPFSYWDRDFSQELVQMIIDFVYDRQPFTYRGTVWQPIDPEKVANGEKIQYMVIDNSKGKGEMIPEPFADHLKFWRGLGVEDFN